MPENSINTNFQNSNLSSTKTIWCGMQMGGFCLGLEFPWGGSGTNRATPSSLMTSLRLYSQDKSPHQLTLVTSSTGVLATSATCTTNSTRGRSAASIPRPVSPPSATGSRTSKYWGIKVALVCCLNKLYTPHLCFNVNKKGQMIVPDWYNRVLYYI